MFPLLNPASEGSTTAESIGTRIRPLVLERRRPDSSWCYIKRIVDTLTGVIVSGLATFAAVNCGMFGRKQGGSGCDTISHTELDLARSRQRHIHHIRSQDNCRRWRVGGGDTRSFCCRGDQDRRSIPPEQRVGQAMRRPCETRSREQNLSSVNARGFFICKIGYVIAPPLSPPSPGRFLPDSDRRRKPRGPFFKIGC